MSSIICTLFEKHYHYGIVTLVNSLYKVGYRGDIYAGYKGELPKWAESAQVNDTICWPGSRSLAIAEGLQLHFLPVSADYHLSNYKPDFMLHLWDNINDNAEQIYYFDPDIVVTAPWSYFEKWANYGATLCTDINSPLAINHPTRLGWREYFGAQALYLKEKSSVYINSGYVGVSKRDRSFIEMWKRVQDLMAPEIGGLNNSSFTKRKGTPLSDDGERRPYYLFAKTDQDALNAAIEAWDGPTSFAGAEAMTFIMGERLMSHALGHPKPWQWKPLAQAIRGHSPRLMERDYWEASKGPIRIYSSSLIRYRQLTMNVAGFIGRFYSRS